MGIGVENGLTNGTLVVPTFQEVSTIFFTCGTDGAVRTPADGMASQKYNHSDRSAVRCSDEVDIRVSNHTCNILQYTCNRPLYAAVTAGIKSQHLFESRKY